MSAGLVGIGDDTLQTAMSGYERAGRREQAMQDTNREISRGVDRARLGLIGGATGLGLGIYNQNQAEEQERQKSGAPAEDPHSIGSLIGFGLSALSRFGFEPQSGRGYKQRIG